MTISSLLFFPFFHFHPIFWLISLFLYFLPAFLARNKPNFNGVLILNILAGWTFIGWIIALVWAVSTPRQAQPAAPAQPPPPSASQPAAGGPFFCSACGKSVVGGARFCGSCGAALPATQR
jgi:TM2 domain-containing membrane protein YozV